MRHVVMFSGGIGSWRAAQRVKTANPSDDVVLLFADTRMEDADRYRFLHESAAALHVEVVTVADGRTPWEVFESVRFLGNTRVDPCSRILKREILRDWLTANCDPDDAAVYLGIDWTEINRMTRAARFWEPWTCTAPLCDPPYETRADALSALRALGVEPPRLYALGFPHNNCGGFCVKAGQAQFRLLYQQLPDRYREHEAQEERLRQHLGKDVSILRDRTGGPVKPLTLRAFRERLDTDGTCDTFDWGGCSCFFPDEYEATT